MSRPILADAFGHHVWATLQLIDTCSTLTPEQLQATVPGTYGSILDTMRHLVGADRRYLELLSGGAVPPIDEEAMDVTALRAVMAESGHVWSTAAVLGLDPALVLTRQRDDGSTSSAPVGIRLAQVVHHGSDHRSQICTALTTLGVTPPAIDVWDFAASEGRLTDTPPTA
jgi:uncharacterized damage-inducible protein DinB